MPVVAGEPDGTVDGHVQTLALALTVTLLGCTITTRSWTIPLAGSPTRAESASCLKACKAQRRLGDDVFYDCLETCPGVIVLDEECSGEVEPVAFCTDETGGHGNYVLAGLAVVGIGLLVYGLLTLDLGVGQEGTEQN